MFAMLEGVVLLLGKRVLTVFAMLEGVLLLGKRVLTVFAMFEGVLLLG